jgi:hypothetical protein
VTAGERLEGRVVPVGTGMTGKIGTMGTDGLAPLPRLRYSVAMTTRTRRRP